MARKILWDVCSWIGDWEVNLEDDVTNVHYVELEFNPTIFPATYLSFPTLHELHSMRSIY